MKPHIDLSKPMDENDTTRRNGSSLRKSTHTFMVHLADCPSGGETVFLQHINQAPNLLHSARGGESSPAQVQAHAQAEGDGGGGGGGGGGGVLGAARPMRGRVVVFPHACPHSGLPVVDVPKRFLRGELLVE
jgi:hypothetical protein